jgi:chromosome partitioning protein
LNVLFIDADPQYTSTSLFAIDAEDENLKTLMHLMFERDYEDKPITDALIPLFKNATLDVLAADIQLGGYDLHATNRSQRELLITKMLKKHAPSLGKYDIILVDTNPGPSQLNQSLMIRADSILVPVSLDVMSVKSLRSMAASLAEVDELAPKERTHMILGNMEQSNMNHSKASRQGLEESYPGELLQTVIPNYSGFRRQGWEDEKGALLLVEREPTSAAAQKLVELSIEVLDRVLWQKQPVAV